MKIPKSIILILILLPCVEATTVDKFCAQMNIEIKKYAWGKIICNPKTWNSDEKFITPGGYPLVFKEFISGTPKSTTLIMCGVHGDELSAIYPCIHLARDILFDNPNDYINTRVIIAPLLNPDGFFKGRTSRSNGNGVDLNRNFPTSDFAEKALISWKTKEKGDPRKFPGEKAGSEIETQFQMMLIERFLPDKIISLHSPYGFIDVDLPSETLEKDISEFLRKAKEVGKKMSKHSNNYPLTNFRIYPGSLGNYAAKEKGIPTYTLEFPTSLAERAHSYWQRMRKGMVLAIQYELVIQRNQD